MVKDPETEALNVKLQQQRKQLEEQIAELKKKHTETTEAAKRNAKLKADMIEFSWSCCICTDYLVKSRLLACGHTFCQSCIEEWLDVNNVCPKCRKPVKVPPLPNTALDETMVNCILELKDFGEDAAKDYKERLDEWEETYSEAMKRKQQRHSNAAEQQRANAAAVAGNVVVLVDGEDGGEVDLTADVAEPEVRIWLVKNASAHARCHQCARSINLGAATVGCVLVLKAVTLQLYQYIDCISLLFPPR